MKTWTGKVTELFERDFQGTKLHSFKIEGVDRWFRTGKEKLPFGQGTFISFTERNSQVDLSTVQESDTPPSASSTEETEAAASKSNPAAATGSSAPTVGQKMAWEAARRDATRIVATALEVEGKGLDVLPWAKNVAKGKRLDLLVSYVNQVAKQLLEQQE